MSETGVTDALEWISRGWFAPSREPTIGNPNQGEPVDRRAWRLCISPTEVTIYLPETVRRPRTDLQLELRYTPRLLVIEYDCNQKSGSNVLELTQTSPGSALGTLFPMIADALSRKRPEASDFALSLCHSALMIAREQVQYPTRLVKGKAARRRETFYALDRFIVENVGSPVSVRDAAADLNMSARYLNRVCNDFRSLTFSQYLNLRRLEFARRKLLSEPQTKIADLALSCGYNRAGYFIKCFRELYGMPPEKLRSELRRSRKKMDPALHRILGFDLLEPLTGDDWFTESEDLPHVSMLVVNTRPTPAAVYWLSPTGEMHYHGEIAANGRWIIGSSYRNVMCFRVSKDEELIYRTEDKNCQVLL
jgi:AraC-like DNA-binding protein